MKILSLSEAKIKLSALIDEVRDRDEEVTITRNGPSRRRARQRGRVRQLAGDGFDPGGRAAR